MKSNAVVANPEVSSRRAPYAWNLPAGRHGLYLGVFVVFLALYVLTAQRGPAWQDSGALQWRILNFDVRGRLGLALAHPLLIVLGRAFSYLPLGPLAWRLNLVSAVCGAVAVANVAVLARRFTPGRPAAAWFAAGLFGLAHTTWWLSTICESQTVLVAVFTTELNVLAMLVRRPRGHLVLLLGALNGLALTAHNLALLAAPVYAAVVLVLALRRRLGWRWVPLLAAGWVVGAAGQIVLVAAWARQAGWGPAVHSALFGRHWQSDVLVGSARALAGGASYVLYNFPNAALPLAVVGLWALRKAPRRTLLWALLALAVVYLLFAVRYSVPDQFMFFLPFYALVGVLAGIGLGRLPVGGRWAWLVPLALASLLLAPGTYAVAPAAWGALRLPLPGRKDLPYRDPARYWLSPWKGREDSAGRFARAALRQAPADAIVVADRTSLYPLLWVRTVELAADRPRLMAADEATPRTVPAGRANVFVVSDREGYCPKWLREAASFQKHGAEGILLRVVWRGGASRGSGPLARRSLGVAAARRSRDDSEVHHHGGA